MIERYLVFHVDFEDGETVNDAINLANNEAKQLGESVQFIRLETPPPLFGHFLGEFTSGQHILTFTNPEVFAPRSQFNFDHQFVMDPCIKLFLMVSFFTSFFIISIIFLAGKFYFNKI